MLDQGQTITVDSVAKVHNLTYHEGYKTVRTCQLGDGLEANLRVDHSKLKNGEVEKHLAQQEVDIVNSETGESGRITLNTTVTAPKWASDTDISNWYAGHTAWVNTNLARIVVFES